MIDILTTTAVAHGGCVECDPTDGRGEGDAVHVFKLGSFIVRLCDLHVDQMFQALHRVLRLRGRT